MAFSVINGDVEQLENVSLLEIGFRERQDLQRWIEEYPEIVGPDLEDDSLVGLASASAKHCAGVKTTNCIRLRCW